MCRGHAPWGHGRAAERPAHKLRRRSIAAPGRASRLGVDSFMRLLDGQTQTLAGEMARSRMQALWGDLVRVRVGGEVGEVFKEAVAEPENRRVSGAIQREFGVKQMK